MIFSRMRALFLVKIMFLSVHFFFAFFSFTLAIRYFNQMDFMINVPSTLAHKITPEYVSGILTHATFHYTAGMRGCYSESADLMALQTAIGCCWEP